MVFDIVNDDMESRDNVFEKGTGTLGWGQNKSTEQNFSLQLMMFRVQKQKERLFM